MENSVQQIISRLQEANHNAERAYWWMEDIDAGQAKSLGICNMVQSVLDILQKVDNATIDIVIAINHNNS